MEQRQHVTVTEVAGLTGLDTIEEDWRRIAANASPPVFVHDFDWFRDYISYQPDRHQASVPVEGIVFLCVHDPNGVMRAIIPLEPGTERIRRVAFRTWRLTRLTTCGDFPCDAHDLEPLILPAVMRHLRKRGDARGLLSLAAVPDGSASWRAVMAARKSGVRVSHYRCQGYNRVPTQGEYESLLQSLSRNFRGNLRKARNKLADEPEAEFRVAREREDLKEAYEELLDLEASGWKGANGRGSALKYRERPRRFHRALALKRSRDHRPEIHTLRVRGRPIAAQLWVRYRQEMIAVKIAYDESFSRMSPGQLLFEHVLKRCCRDDAILHANVMTDQAWHHGWNPETIPCHGFYLPLLRPRAWLADLLLRAPTTSRLRRFVRKA